MPDIRLIYHAPKSRIAGQRHQMKRSGPEDSTTTVTRFGLPQTLRVQLVQRVNELQEIAADYQKIAECADGTLFPSFRLDWICALEEIYFPDSRHTPFLLLIWHGERLIGAAPLRRVVRGVPPLAFAWLEFIGQHTGHGTLDNLTGDFLVSREDDREAVLQAIQQALIGPLRSCWDGVSLKRFCSNSPSFESFLKLFPEADVSQEEMPGFLIELGSDFDIVWNQLDAKARKNLRRASRLLETSELEASFETRTTLDDELFGEITALHTERQRRLLQLGKEDRDDLLANGEMNKRIRQILGSMVTSGSCRLHLLRIEKQLAAFLIIFANASGANSWLVAFDEEFARFSPSRLMFEYTYRVEIEQFATPRINLMLGFTPAKRDFSNRTYTSFGVVLYNRWSLASRVRRRMLSAYKRLSGSLRGR